VGRDPIQVEQLVGAEPENIQHVVLDPGGAGGEERGERGVEGSPLAQDARGDLVGERAIGIP
jgi:hypothetical protein